MVLYAKKDDTWIRIPYLSVTTSDSSINDAPFDGKQYARQNGEWTVVNIPETTEITWDKVSGKPTWIGATKPSYNVTEITDAVSTTDSRLSDKRVADGGNADTVNNLTVLTAVPANAKFTDTVYDDTSITNRISTVETNKVDKTSIGSVNGIAQLDSVGKVPSSQLPSYVDDVIEFASHSAFPIEGESGKIYIDVETNLTYRWSGTTYVKIASDLALGETSSTAYAGDKGKQNATDIATLKTNKVDKVDGKSLIADTEITRLAEIDNYDDSSVVSRIGALETDKANTADVYTKLEVDEAFQPKGNYITSIPDEYVTDNELIQKDYATKSDIPSTLPASDVFDWAKAETKPSYDVTEISNAVATTDNRLSDARTPLAHTHTKENITDFSHVHEKADITDFAHSHAITDITNLSTTLDNKVDVVAGKGLSTNDYDATAKGKVDALKAVATSGSYTDLINTPTIPTVDVTKGYVDGELAKKADKSDIASVYKVKGSVANYEALPTTDVAVGDVYNLIDTGANYVATSTVPEWDKMSETVDLSGYVQDAPKDDKLYARRNGNWTKVSTLDSANDLTELVYNTFFDSRIDSITPEQREELLKYVDYDKKYVAYYPDQYFVLIIAMWDSDNNEFSFITKLMDEYLFAGFTDVFNSFTVRSDNSITGNYVNTSIFYDNSTGNLITSVYNMADDTTVALCMALHGDGTKALTDDGTYHSYAAADHNHDGAYQPVGSYVDDAPSDGKTYLRKDGEWSEYMNPDEMDLIRLSKALKFNASGAPTEGTVLTDEDIATILQYFDVYGSPSSVSSSIKGFMISGINNKAMSENPDSICFLVDGSIILEEDDNVISVFGNQVPYGYGSNVFYRTNYFVYDVMFSVDLTTKEIYDVYKKARGISSSTDEVTILTEKVNCSLRFNGDGTKILTDKNTYTRVEPALFNSFNSVTTLTSLPVDKYGIKATVSSNTAISFTKTPTEGSEYMIYILSPTAFTQAIPNAGIWQSDVASIDIEANKVTSISIRYIHGKYVFRV